MLNEQEYLLACLGEECGELQQVVGKSLRFGAFDSHEKTDNVSNAELVRREFHDVVAVYSMYMGSIGESVLISSKILIAKETKVSNYMEAYLNDAV